MESFRRIMDLVGTTIDGVGVFIVAGGALVATARLAVRRGQHWELLFALSPGRGTRDFARSGISHRR